MDTCQTKIVATSLLDLDITRKGFVPDSPSSYEILSHPVEKGGNKKNVLVPVVSGTRVYRNGEGDAAYYLPGLTVPKDGGFCLWQSMGERIFRIDGHQQTHPWIEIERVEGVPKHVDIRGIPALQGMDGETKGVGALLSRYFLQKYRDSVISGSFSSYNARAFDRAVLALKEGVFRELNPLHSPFSEYIPFLKIVYALG